MNKLPVELGELLDVEQPTNVTSPATNSRPTHARDFISILLRVYPRDPKGTKSRFWGTHLCIRNATEEQTSAVGWNPLARGKLPWTEQSAMIPSPVVLLRVFRLRSNQTAISGWVNFLNYRGRFTC